MPHPWTYRVLPLVFLFALGLNLNGCSQAANKAAASQNEPANPKTIDGKVNGLSGTLQLKTDDGTTITVSNSKVFSLKVGTTSNPTELTVLTQPDGQTCTVIVGPADAQGIVTDVSVNCIANVYTLGGNISGLRGSVVLQNNLGDTVTVASNAAFSFPSQVPYSASYATSVLTQPEGQLCTVSDGAGIATSAVTSIAVSCENLPGVSGTVSGLGGSLVLQYNGGSLQTLTTNGRFHFPPASASNYSITVFTQPGGQVCNIANGFGAYGNQASTNILVTCTTNSYPIGGLTSGLRGTVVLQNNGEVKGLSANGEFNFALAVSHGGRYEVSVLAQPLNQVCSVSRGADNAFNPVRNIGIDCLDTYSIGGTIAGINGTAVLQNNNGDYLAVSTNGEFKFPQRWARGTYAVTVFASPTGQKCTAANNNGSINNANVTNVTVTCTTNTYTVGGTVTGLSGTVDLQTGSGERISVSANGSFQFPTAIVAGSYSAQVVAQPVGQICTMTRANGIVLDANVSQITVNCANRTYTISGTITGLVGSVVLRNNGGNDLTTTANGSFTFTTLISHGSAYAVTIFAPPSGQTCSVTNGSGTATTSITQISVNCASTPPKLSLTSNIKQLRFTWTPMLGATYYKFMTNQDGTSGFTQIGANLTVTNANVDIAIHRFNWSKASYLVSACNTANVCADSNTVFPLAEAVKSIGYVKASNSGPGDAFGASIAISGDGMTLAVAANLEDSGTVGTSSTPNEAAADAGAVYVYTNVSGAWVQQAYVKASNPGAGDFFGASIALSADGNTLAVGSHSEDSSTVGTNPSFNDLAANTGAVYVFTRSAAAWAQQAYLKASNSGAGDEFGRNLSLAADGKTLAIGAMYEDSSTAGTVPDKLAADSGAVYVFILESTGWRHTSYIKASNIGTGDLFGSSVALSPDGNTLAVGAPLEDGDTLSSQATPNELGTNSGATYIFTRNSNAWTQQAYLKASNVGNGDAFGGSLTLSSDGNTLAVGAAAEASSNVGINGVPNENAAGAGAVYVYTRATASWTKQAFVKAVNAGAGDYFGTSVVLSSDGNILAVGAPGEDSNATGVNGTANESASDSGAVYIYARTGGAWGSISFVKAANTDAGDSFGNSVSLSSDANTLAIGAKAESGNGVGIAGDRTNNTSTSAGAAYLY